ncbi:MAG TPA: phosphoribosyltransferase family protein [Nitrososphaera sp.]|nr:phosphoribosyltransferase family protein [Nitrososphaera sp.]
MSTEITVIDLGQLFRTGREGMLSERMFSVFRKKISDTLGKRKDNKPLLFDLFGVNAIPKLSMAQKLQATFDSNPSLLSNVFFFNVSEEFYTSLQQPFLAQSAIPSRLKLLPFILLNGQWRWLGLLSREVEESLNLIIRNQLITTDFIQRLLNLSASQVEILKASVDANPSYFVYDYKKEIMKCAFNANKLLSNIIKYERKSLTKAFIDAGLLKSGHFLLPSGFHVDKCVLTSQVPQHPNLFKRIYAQVSRCIWVSAPDIVITSSLLSFMIGERLRTERNQQVITTFGYPIPRPRYGETISSGDRAFILTDIYSTGSALNHIRKQVFANQGIIAGAMSIVDAHGRGAKDNINASIKLNVPLKNERNCSNCESNTKLQLLDPFSCLPFDYVVKSKAPKSLLKQSEFWNMLREKDAIRDEHLIYNGNHFSLFIKTRNILRDLSISRDLATRAISELGPNFDAILIPKNEGALLLAQAIQEFLRHHFGRTPAVITCARDHERNVFVIPKLMYKSLKNASLLVVDDGANTGHTLLGLHFSVEAIKPKKINYLVFIDRLFGTDRQSVDVILGSNYTCLFHLAVPVYREWDCPLCFAEESQSYYSHGQQVTQAEQLIPSRSAGPRRVTKLVWEADKK